MGLQKRFAVLIYQRGVICNKRNRKTGQVCKPRGVSELQGSYLFRS